MDKRKIVYTFCSKRGEPFTISYNHHKSLARPNMSIADHAGKQYIEGYYITPF